MLQSRKSKKESNCQYNFENLNRDNLSKEKIEVKDINNKKTKEIELTLVKNVDENKIAKVIKWQQSKIRLGTHNTRDVSEISYSTKKLRKQKGGGCARFRNKGAVQFRGGGTIFGPDGRVYDYNINKKEKVLGLKHAITIKVQEKNFIVLEDFNIKEYSVKKFLDFKKKYNIESDSLLLIDDNKNDFILGSIANLHKTNYLPVVGINVLSVINSEVVIITLNAIEQLQKRGVI